MLVLAARLLWAARQLRFVKKFLPVTKKIKQYALKKKIPSTLSKVPSVGMPLYQGLRDVAAKLPPPPPKGGHGIGKEIMIFSASIFGIFLGMSLVYRLLGGRRAKVLHTDSQGRQVNPMTGLPILPSNKEN